MTTYAPRRGDVVWLTFNPQAGHEQAGRQPAIVISPESYNRKVGLALFCPITTRVKGYPFEVALPESHGTTGAILTDQLKSLDWRARRVEFIETLPEKVVAEVLRKVNLLTG